MDDNQKHRLLRAPILAWGSGIAPRELGDKISLLDVPATVLWALGVEVPAEYEGRALREAIPSGRIAA